MGDHIYNLYDIFSYRINSLMKSLKLEYQLDRRECTMVVIRRLLLEHKLDEDSHSVALNAKFCLMLMQPLDILYESKYYERDSMYELDIILLEVDTDASRRLISKYGSQAAYKYVKPEIFPREIMKKIILNTTDLQTLINYYNSSKQYKDFIDDNLKLIFDNMIEALRDNPNRITYSGSYPKDGTIDDPFPRYGSRSAFITSFKHLISEYRNIYSYHIYTNADNCNTFGYIRCYYQATLLEDVEGAKLLIDKMNFNYSSMVDNGFHVPYLSDYPALPIEVIMTLVQEVPIFTRNVIETRHLIVNVLVEHSNKCNIMHNELSHYKQLLSLTDPLDRKLLNITIYCPVLFKLVYDTLREQDYNVSVDNINLCKKLSPKNIRLIYDSIITAIPDEFDNYVQKWDNDIVERFIKYLKYSDDNLTSVKEFIDLGKDIRIPHDILLQSLIKLLQNNSISNDTRDYISNYITNNM